MPADLRTQAIVLRRTNYGESDRILNLLTPEGKVSVIARGVRKEKSRLAGSIELFLWPMSSSTRATPTLVFSLVRRCYVFTKGYCRTSRDLSLQAVF